MGEQGQCAPVSSLLFTSPSMFQTALFALLLFLHSEYRLFTFGPLCVSGFRLNKTVNSGFTSVVVPPLRALNNSKNALLGVAESRGDAADGPGLRRLLRKSGIFAKVAPGILCSLPIGKRILSRLERVIRVEMARLGAHEIGLPLLQPSGIINQRKKDFGNELYVVRDRHGKTLHLGPTCEELASRVITNTLCPISKRHLPLSVYQIGTKFRDEARPCDVTMRCREFSMKDAYSFHPDAASAAETYDQYKKAYQQILDKLGIVYTIKTISDNGCVEEEFTVTLPDAELEVAHIFQLGTALTQEAEMSFEIESRSRKPVYLNSYGIGLERLVHAAASQHSDADGLCLPQIIAPYDVAIVVCDPDNDDLVKLARDIQILLSHKGLDTLVDCGTASVKQRSADIRCVGIPHVVYVTTSEHAKGLEPDNTARDQITHLSSQSNYYHLWQSEHSTLAKDSSVDAEKVFSRHVGYSHRSLPGEYHIPVSRLMELLCV
ncbi:proline tRNA ligase [Babesia ovis]|uniref:proline--tRNA ligase n=1 Tax=Babesia ovis TaxID=5869 RepID=A0A9W5TCH0_BABOV|nr:proline tRNA ligase [Babesia ovis]